MNYLPDFTRALPAFPFAAFQKSKFCSSKKEEVETSTPAVAAAGACTSGTGPPAPTSGPGWPPHVRCYWYVWTCWRWTSRIPQDTCSRRRVFLWNNAGVHRNRIEIAESIRNSNCKLIVQSQGQSAIESQGQSTISQSQLCKLHYQFAIQIANWLCNLLLNPDSIAGATRFV